ncbi:hypothetical protein C3743_34990 [Burkholderia contaminans]|uniref:Uncharacterized protein n=1 Tax=Burkholderia contaminans TaxID=488447 RepID=A0A2S5DP43_9BURK|nr:hypothetical protein C3743_34990 [Burkholderia contaminans]
MPVGGAVSAARALPPIDHDVVLHPVARAWSSADRRLAPCRRRAKEGAMCARRRAAHRPGAERRCLPSVRVAALIIASDNSDAVHNRSKMASS